MIPQQPIVFLADSTLKCQTRNRTHGTNSLSRKTRTFSKDFAISRFKFDLMPDAVPAAGQDDG